MQYFHINHTTDYSGYRAISVGDILETSREGFNPYFRNTLNGPKKFNLSDKESLPILDFFRRLSLGELDNYKQLMNHREVARYSFQFLSSFIKITREMHFENVRVRNFSELPSRQHCIWLAESLEDAQYWKERLVGRVNCRIFRVEVDGSVFRTNEGHLIQEAEPFDITIQRAKDYWNGRPSNGRNEVLFEGSFRVLEQVD